MSTKLQVYKIPELPRESLRDGLLTRSAIRSDGCIVTFNWFAPGSIEQPPHSHPFDQLAFVLQGSMVFIVDGTEYLLEAGSALRIPASVPHTSRVAGDGMALNVDVFAPAREDYLYLAANTVEYQAGSDQP
ncbi:MAG TPA: cupin domain-containing protein [Bordetella sp.]|nr:cupin domain-containing protein [Bordetella sp.]